MKFETPTPADEPGIKQLLAECELPYEDITAQHLKHFIVCREGASLAGIVGLEVHGKGALLRSLAVAKSHRGLGIASKLVEETESLAQALGVDSIYLLTTTAEGFFSKLRYTRIDRATVPQEIQETTEFKILCPSSAVCMMKNL